MRTEKQLDQTISKWLEAEAPVQLPDRVLEATFERTRKTKQRGGWRALLGKLNLNQSVFALAGAAVVVLAATAALSVYLNNARLGGLPSTPDAWSRVAIDTQFATAQVDENSLAASSRGLLALVGEIGSGRFELAVSSDGYEWLTIPSEQHPALDGHRVKLTGTDRGFLMLVDNDLWTSANGFDWQRLAGSAQDTDLRQGEMFAVAVGGPGLVAVGGDNKAWYSTDGSDWALADVPPPPSGVFEEAGLPEPIVTMRGVAAAGATLVAWGSGEASLGELAKSMGVLWRSSDGLSWVNVPEPEMNSLTGVAGGPRGFVAISDLHIEGSDLDGLPPAAFVSSDGLSWERATDIIDKGAANPFVAEAVAAGSSGFVAGGTDGTQVLIWTSADGRSWSALGGSDLFRGAPTSDPDGGARATSVAAWGSRFAVAGHYERKPVMWISGSRPGGTSEPAATIQPNPTDPAQELTPVAATPTPTPMPPGTPTPRPTPAPTPITWTIQSDAEDWPAPPRTEQPGTPIESSAPVAPGWLRYTDTVADTTPADVAAVDISTIQIGDGCGPGAAQTTCLELTLAGHVDEPRPNPVEAWFGFGIVVDIDSDDQPDYRYGVDNAGRSWRTDLRTGETVTTTEFDDALYAEFPPGASATGGDLPEAIFHLRESGFRFYGWSSLIADGRVQATDYAPDVGWLEVPDVAFAGSWESTEVDGSHRTMEVVALSDGGYDVTILDDRARVCDRTPSTMTGVAERADLGTIVIAQPGYTCDDGSQTQTVSGPPLEEQLRNYSLSYDSSRDVLLDPAALEWTRAEVTP